MQQQQEPDPLLTVEDVARRVRVSSDHVRRAARSKQLEGYKVGRSWRFTWRHVELWLQKQSA